MASFRAWCRFFRLPNLPTAPGDAIAGAAFITASNLEMSHALAAGAASLAAYMFGLADNDIAGMSSDDPSSGRPLADGTMSAKEAHVARATCLAAAIAVGVAMSFPCAWWIAMAVLAVLVVVYNRTKSRWLMGLCRGVSVASGAFAVWTPMWQGPQKFMLLLLVLGWTAQVAAVTWLSEGEESESGGLGAFRYLGGLAAFIPLASCAFAWSSQNVSVMPIAGSVFACLAWCVAVAPLGVPHGPAVRRRAVGMAVGALLYLQIGYMLSVPRAGFVAVSLALWACARGIRRIVPDITGS